MPVTYLILLVLIGTQLLHKLAAAIKPNTSDFEKQVDNDNFNDSNSTPKIIFDLLNKSRNEVITPNRQVCAFMNVSHNSSYTIYDREEFSQGLEHIHSTSGIFEEFYNIILQPGCEAKICELVLLDPVARRRKCYSFNESRDLTLDAGKAADPATHNYFVSTGCSCKDPMPGCNSTKCNSVILEEGECAKLFKENSCSECRYDAISFKELDSGFIPTNGFWCESFVVRDGCRISIDRFDENGTIISNYANYTGISSNISLNYVRKPTPPKFRCICDLEDIIADQGRQSWIIALSVGLVAILLIGIIAIVLKTCIILRIRVEKKISSDEIETLIRRFRHGFSKEDVNGLDNANFDDKNECVSTGYLKAVQQPYQHKWEISRDRILLGNQIGVGEFGVVYLAELFKDGARKGQKVQVAGKAPKLKTISCFNSVLEEIKVWSYIGQHRNVCKFIGACTEDIPRQDALIILEYCSEKNLKDYLIKNQNSFLESSEINCNPVVHYVTLSNSGTAVLGPFGCKSSRPKILYSKFKQLLKWAGQIASGMEYIGSKQVVHIDLAARNIFLDAFLECKIGDFGLSQRLQEVVNYVRVADEHKIPFRYMALESLKDFKFTTFSDVWSYGVTIFEIFSLGSDPYPKMIGFSDLVQMLRQGKRLEKPLHCSDEIYRTMLQCWDEDTQKRPSFAELKHLFECHLIDNIERKD